MGKYDEGNNDWIMMDNRPGEWYVAYHGIRISGMHQVVTNVMNQGLMSGKGQTMKFHKCLKTG